MHIKKMIAPIVITVLTVLYLIGYLAVCLLVDIPMGFKILGLIILLALIGTIIFVLVERIREINSGEEDDLSKY